MHMHQIIDRLLSIQFNSTEGRKEYTFQFEVNVKLKTIENHEREAVTSVISREGQLWSSGQQTSEYFALSSAQWILGGQY